MNVAVWVERNGLRWADRPAIALGDEMHADWATFGARVAAVAGGLRARIGLQPDGFVERLPTNNYGKVLKRELREQFDHQP